MEIHAIRLAAAIGLVVALGSSACVVPPKTPAIHPGASVPSIDFGRLAQLAQASAAAYDAGAAIEGAYGTHNVVVRSLPTTDGHYFNLFNHKDRVQTLAIRGTTSKANARVDVNSVKILDATLGIFLHQGFKGATDDLYADAAPFLRKDYKTRITGHSLGGAIACIVMMRLVRDGYHVEQVVTFGQPKVTNADGGAAFTSVSYVRIINDRDAVPQVPPSNVLYDLSGAYEHFGPEITLVANKTYTYSQVHTSRDLIGNNWWKIDPDDVLDHQIKNYVERLNALKGSARESGAP